MFNLHAHSLCSLTHTAQDSVILLQILVPDRPLPGQFIGFDLDIIPPVAVIVIASLVYNSQANWLAAPCLPQALLSCESNDLSISRIRHSDISNDTEKLY